MIEPRNIVVGAAAVPLVCGNIDVLKREWAQRPGTEVPPGSESRARTHKGSPGTWEAPWLPAERWVPPPESRKGGADELRGVGVPRYD